MTHLFSRNEVYDWVDNDDGLFNWWRSTGLTKREFIHNNRTELETCINLMNSGQKPRHYLTYYLAYDRDIQDKDIRKK